jgi:transposase
MSSAPLIVGQCGKEVNMEVVIGVDPHKGTNAVAVLNDREQLLEYAVFVTNRAGLRSLARWAKRFGERRWAVEGASGLGRPVAQHLVAAGETVVDVPAKLSSRIRLLSVGNERKNDQVDAICVAVAALRVKRLTEVGEEEQATVLRMLSERRKDLMKERTRTLNRLHGLLRDLVPGGAPKNLSAHKKAALLLRGVRPRVDPALTRRRLAADLIGDVRRLDRRLSDLERYIREGVEQASTGLTGLFGVGPILAAKIIGEVGTIARFPTKAHFASYTGTAPIEASSADVVRHRLSRAGNRQLNHALHLIAICQIRHDKDRLITGASSPKASPRKKRCVVSSGESRMRSSRSYTRTWRVESRTWLDTQRGLFAGVLHPSQFAAHRRVAHRDPGHHLQVIPPLGERDEGTFLHVRCQEPPGPLIELWLRAGSLLWGEGLPLDRRPGVSLDRGEAHSEGASDLALSHTTLEHRRHNLLSEVLGVCVHPSMMLDGSVTLQPAVAVVC